MIRNSGILLILMALFARAASPRLDFAFGVLAESRGQDAEAGRLFEAARQADPTALPLVRRAVGARLEEGNRSAAVKLYRDLAIARPDALGIQLAYADFLQENGRGDSMAMKLAAETLDAALAKNPGNPEVVRRLFQLASSAGNKTRQRTLLEMLPVDDPAATALFASLAKSMSDATDADALAELDRRFLESFEAHPGDPGLARAASDHFRNTKRPDRAIEILQHHINIAPSSLDLRTRLGVLYFTAKRDTEGESTLLEVLAIHPRQALAHQSLAKFYRLRDKPEPARFHAGELLKIRGGSPTDFLNLADEWLVAENPREARLLLERAVFEHPDNPKLADKLAIATRRDPETRDQAARLFREAEAAQPADKKSTPEFLIESAEALISEGQSKAAEERLRSAIKAFPPEAKKETATALRRLAQLWETENRNAEAARALRQRADTLDR